MRHETSHVDKLSHKGMAECCKMLEIRREIDFTTLNGLFPQYHTVKDFLESSTKEGNAIVEKLLDLMTFRDYNTTVFEDVNGNQKYLQCNERYYVPSENYLVIEIT